MSNVSLVDGHIDEPKMTDEEIKKALECIKSSGLRKLNKCGSCKYSKSNVCNIWDLLKDALDLINRKDAEIERLQSRNKFLEIEFKNNSNLFDSRMKEIKSEAIKELDEKITEVFMRYAHLHSYAEGARKDYIEADDGTEIEMQSVWDVFTLKKYDMAEYEEMGRLQKNIETIEKERLLTELEKDFRLLVKEMVGE